MYSNFYLVNSEVILYSNEWMSFLCRQEIECLLIYLFKFHFHAPILIFLLCNTMHWFNLFSNNEISF